jgi:fucose 4-O-acetylase-like acetyltransferase
MGGENVNDGNGRIFWIDFAKVLGIIMVVMGHMQLEENIINIIFSFHMPLFFFLSGFIDKNRNIKQTVGIAIKTLLIPYCLLLQLIIYGGSQ